MKGFSELQAQISLKILQVSFDTPIQPYELSAFRGAVANAVGWEHEWFHNHNAQTGGLHHRYPLIQYKLETLKKNNAMRPMMLFLHLAVDEAQFFFNRPDWALNLLGNPLPLRIARLNADVHLLQAVEKPLLYRLHKWMPFDSDAFQHWQALEGIVPKIAFLQKKIENNILGFASAIGWKIDVHFVVTILDIHKEEWISFKKIKHKVFTLDFKINLHLPDYIGIGNAANQGHGVIRQQFFQK